MEFERGHTEIFEMLRSYPEQKIALISECSAWFGTAVRVSKDKYSSASRIEELDLDYIF